MENVDALVKQLRVTLLYLRVYLLDAQTRHLQVLLICLPQYLLQLNNLGDATLTRNYCTNRVLNR